MPAFFGCDTTPVASKIRPGTIVGFAVFTWSSAIAYEIVAPRETPSTRAR